MKRPRPRRGRAAPRARPRPRRAGRRGRRPAPKPAPKPKRGSSRKARSSARAPLGYTKRGEVRVRNYTPRGTAPKRSQADIMRAREAVARDIGKCLSPLHPERWAACRLDLERFLRTYMPDTFYRPFSADHRRVIAKTQTALLAGGLFSEVCYRGFGKSAILRGAVAWAVCYGHKPFIPMLAATKDLAEDELLGKLKTFFEQSDVLLEDFEAICKPARALEGLPHRCAGQLSNGRPTRIEWGVASIVLPVVEVWKRTPDGSEPTECEPAPSNGVKLLALGLTSSFRGLTHAMPDGRIVRPSFVVIDDPQTDASAASPAQCVTRERIINRAVLGLAGHSETLSAIMPCTIIRKGDMADRLTDRTAHPEWQGDVLPMVKAWAVRHEDLWLGKYAELRRQDLPEGQGGRAAAERQATEFYRDNRAEMDRGAEVSDPAAFKPDELSAVQHAYNLLIDRGDACFMAEFQCAPLDEGLPGEDLPLEPRDVLAKCNRLPRAVCPHGSTLVVGFIDCRAPELHSMVCAFGSGFSGQLVEASARRYLGGDSRKLGGAEGALAVALSREIDLVCSRVYSVEDGGELRVAICGVDSGWLTRTVYETLRRSRHAAVLAPTKGEGGERDLRTPKNLPAQDHGEQWFQALNQERDARLLVYNVDHWKSFTAERIRTPAGGRGSLGIWGEGDRTQWILAEHLTAERPGPKRRSDGTTFQKWRELRGRPNHWWDTLVGCHACAARMGARLDTAPKPPGTSGGYRFKGARNAG